MNPLSGVFPLLAGYPRAQSRFREVGHETPAQEHAEVIEIHWVPFAQACDWAIDGTIVDCKTALGLLRARETLRTNGSARAGVS